MAGSINSLTQGDEVMWTNYTQRVGTILEWFDSQGRGARARCARELGWHPSRVSTLLTLGRVSVHDLLIAEVWVGRQR